MKFGYILSSRFFSRATDINHKNSQLTVTFDDGCVVTYDFLELDQLVPAFVISVHKSQGGEHPAIVQVLHISHKIMLQRNLLYTGVTRAKKVVVLVGSWEAVKLAVDNNRESNRFTGLYARLRRGS